MATVTHGGDGGGMVDAASGGVQVVAGRCFVWDPDLALRLRLLHRLPGRFVGRRPPGSKQAREEVLPVQLLREEAALALSHSWIRLPARVPTPSPSAHLSRTHAAEGAVEPLTAGDGSEKGKLEGLVVEAAGGEGHQSGDKRKRIGGSGAEGEGHGAGPAKGAEASSGGMKKAKVDKNERVSIPLVRPGFSAARISPASWCVSLQLSGLQVRCLWPTWAYQTEESVM
ncbi:hypothetical protein T484DRAFT_1907536 [Baffinella frigidus]|nr:hypothetical protein T484DRAFT_1907536 [Cryptophyta sp. CCMP2293]